MDALVCRYGWNPCLLKSSHMSFSRRNIRKRQHLSLPMDGICPRALYTSIRIEATLAIPTEFDMSLSVVAPLPCQGPALQLDSFSVIGGNKLSGHVNISGAKNSALAVLAGSLCSSEEVCLRLVPDLLDVKMMLQVLRSLGVHARQCGSDVYINARGLASAEPCANAIQKIRAGFFVIGALVARHGEAILALPGGCCIGSRPIDIHLRGLEALGAKVEVRQGKVHAYAENGRRLNGGNFHFDFPSVGATETLMMAACLADGESVLSNVAREPEVVDLARFLITCGANIEGAGTSKLIIKGVKKLHGTVYSVMPDRIEAGTFLIAAAIMQSSISLSPVIPNHLTAVVEKLTRIGCHFREHDDGILQIIPSSSLRGVKMITGPYPGFPTDLQPQLMSLMTMCHGESSIKEMVFENRMSHAKELQRLGAKIRLLRNEAIINGRDMGSFLSGTRVKAKDLRAGAALVLAGLAAEGITTIEGAEHVDRGYEAFDNKLRMLGANIQKTKSG